MKDWRSCNADSLPLRIPHPLLPGLSGHPAPPGKYGPDRPMLERGGGRSASPRSGARGEHTHHGGAAGIPTPVQVETAGYFGVVEVKFGTTCYADDL